LWNFKEDELLLTNAANWKRANGVAGNDLDAILRRIDRRLKKLKLSDRAASLAAGFSADLIRNMRRRYQRDARTSATTRALNNLAEPLKTSPEWLARGTGPEETNRLARADAQPPAAVDGIVLRVRGIASPGIWVEASVDPSLSVAPLVLADARFPPEAQYAIEVRGSAIDHIAHEGDYLVVLGDKAKLAPKHGDLVIVSRSIERGLRELTARRYCVDDHGTELRFESSDQRFVDPKHSGYRAPLRLEEPPKGEKIEVRGVVLGVYRPFT
jgi:hypothetical protein